MREAIMMPCGSWQPHLNIVTNFYRYSNNHLYSANWESCFSLSSGIISNRPEKQNPSSASHACPYDDGQDSAGSANPFWDNLLFVSNILIIVVHFLTPANALYLPGFVR
jgi:hypothetical protein